MNAVNSVLAGVILAGTLAALAVGEPRDSVIASADEAEVCATDGLPGSAYSRLHRVVKRKPVPGHILDHVVPLCLGGADVDANVQVQSYADAEAKDALERLACIRVCRRHDLGLAEAQGWFLTDWRIAYEREIAAQR